MGITEQSRSDEEGVAVYTRADLLLLSAPQLAHHLHPHIYRALDGASEKNSREKLRARSQIELLCIRTSGQSSAATWVSQGGERGGWRLG